MIPTHGENGQKQFPLSKRETAKLLTTKSLALSCRQLIYDTLRSLIADNK